MQTLSPQAPKPPAYYEADGPPMDIAPGVAYVSTPGPSNAVRRLDFGQPRPVFPAPRQTVIPGPAPGVGIRFQVSPLHATSPVSEGSPSPGTSPGSNRGTSEGSPTPPPMSPGSPPGVSGGSSPGASGGSGSTPRYAIAGGSGGSSGSSGPRYAIPGRLSESPILRPPPTVRQGVLVDAAGLPCKCCYVCFGGQGGLAPLAGLNNCCSLKI